MDEDSEGNFEDAFELYTNAVEIYLKIVKIENWKKLKKLKIKMFNKKAEQKSIERWKFQPVTTKCATGSEKSRRIEENDEQESQRLKGEREYANVEQWERPTKAEPKLGRRRRWRRG